MPKSRSLRDSRIRVERVVRIVRSGALYVKSVVGYRHYVGNKGPYTNTLQPFKEPPEDTPDLIELWKASGSIKTFK